MSPDGAQPVDAVAVNGALPGPVIRVREGDTLRVVLENGLADQATTIHWHGLLVPGPMDGVPDVTQAPVPSRQLFVYEYPIRQSGTYWYHSHVGLQEQQGLYGAFVIEPRAETLAYDRDYVVMLGDWLHSDPYAVIPRLRKKTAQAAAGGTAGTMAGSMETGGHGGMRMTGAADLSDVAYDAFLLNGRAGPDRWAGVARPGERVRLRVINSGASTFFRLMVDGLPLTVVQADGQPVVPVEVDHLLIGMGETYDVLVTLRESGAVAIRGLAQDGSGQAVGILHTPDAKPVVEAAAPRLGPRRLSYGQLKATGPTALPDGPSRDYRLDLTGDMAAYVWSINEQVYPKADPLVVRQGDRVRVTMTNRTRMWHPMHLHGHFFRVLTGEGDDPTAPLKHTVSLGPNETVRIELTADNPGRWFFHCHNLYHLEAGMARVWIYEI